MWRSPFEYFTDAVLRGPTLGCMLMCFAASLVGVVVFLRKESLLGESLSHAAYPGIILGVLVASSLIGDMPSEAGLATIILCGAFITSFLGLRTISWLEDRYRLRSDSALTLVLACFMGIGLTIASKIQFTHTALYRQAQNYLFGQAATMTDRHVIMYGILSLATAAVIFIFYKELKTITFDRGFAKAIGLRVTLIDYLVFILTVFVVVLGLRSVGVVLMSAMFIAPPVTARQFTNRFSIMLLFAGFVGLLGGFLGNYLSVEVSEWLEKEYLNQRLALPTGPMIIIVTSSLCLLSLLLAPQRGLLSRIWRRASFRYRCICENVLKSIWRSGPRNAMSFEQVAKYQHISSFYLYFVMTRLRLGGWIVKLKNGLYRLTKDGRHRAARIVRLHRLWEVYLADQLGLGIERIHRNAEEMEHILTPEIEEQLILLLQDPKQDPHHQPIPPRQYL
ncbi:MAG: iron chelate uptake ABC transporter family permease subunit [Chlamydiales bacterium]|nr:iron chelate uptake ABC transporter family permease subunit [Chlamydiales bacterium]